MYVFVNHKPNSSRNYLFYVPKHLERQVFVNSEVLCLTRRGNSFGVVTGLMMTEPSKEEIKRLTNGSKQVKPIVAVAQQYDMRNVQVPEEYKTTPPSLEKLKQRLNEWYATGRCYTPIIFAPDGTLIDGYSAYLVAKLFGRKTIKGFCVGNTDNTKGGTK